MHTCPGLLVNLNHTSSLWTVFCMFHCSHRIVKHEVLCSEVLNQWCPDFILRGPKLKPNCQPWANSERMYCWDAKWFLIDWLPAHVSLCLPCSNHEESLIIRGHTYLKSIFTWQKINGMNRDLCYISGGCRSAELPNKVEWSPCVWFLF